jgi:AraC-like DNA-binding protein
MKKTPTISASKLLSLFTLLERKGIDVKAFLVESGIDPDIAAYPDRRVSLETVSELNRKASELVEDDFIGLHQGEVFTGFSNILGYVLMNCRDAAEAIEKYTKYQQIVDEGRILLCDIRDDQVSLQYRIADSSPHDDHHHTEHLMMGMVTYSRILTGWDSKEGYREVHFVHEAPRDTSEYERLFQCKPHFSSHMNALIFDKAFLSLPILQPNRELLVVLEGYAREVLSKLQADDSHANKVKQVIVNILRGESPTIGMIASRVNMSIRNLQLKLKEEGTTYSTLLAEGRRELAQAYLKDRNVPIEEIAYLLGFSEPSVFHRTFKRWTGTTPGLYRKQVMNAKPF